MRELGEIGVKNTIMLTGDRKQIAEKIARDLKVGKVYSELLPKDKVEKLDETISCRDLMARGAVISLASTRDTRQRTI